MIAVVTHIFSVVLLVEVGAEEVLLHVNVSRLLAEHRVQLPLLEVTNRVLCELVVLGDGIARALGVGRLLLNLREASEQLILQLQKLEDLAARCLLAGLEGLELLRSLGHRLLQGNELHGLLLELLQRLLLLHDELEFAYEALLTAADLIGSAYCLWDFRRVFIGHIRQ